MGKFSFVDLFAGIGGFHIALSDVGGECIGFSEIAPDAINAYCENYNEPISNNFGDITTLKTLPEHDFMTAGVPCQSWSIAGKKLGFDDDRGQLWNDTIYLLNKVRPKAFIFENVKGLADPRNSEALEYIMARIRAAGYYAQKFILNAYDYGVPQNRVRIYIIGFKDEKYFKRFQLPVPCPGKVCLNDILDGCQTNMTRSLNQTKSRWSLSCNDRGFNDYFLFNDLRNGNTTIHSWDIEDTTEREKYICNLLLSNRRKKEYGRLDGNPLSLEHFRDLDSSISLNELEILVSKGILKKVTYLYEIKKTCSDFSDEEQIVLSFARGNIINIDELKVQRIFKINRINISKIVDSLMERGVVESFEERYDFKHTKISTGLDGINRIFLRSSKIYPTMVASDTNDFVATVDIDGNTPEEYKANFMKHVYKAKKFRRITKKEACRIQGFPADFKLPESRSRWMKLIGNSVAVSLVRMLAQSVVSTGVFCEQDCVKPVNKSYERELEPVQGNLFTF